MKRKKISYKKYKKIIDLCVEDSRGMTIEEVLIRLLEVAAKHDLADKKPKLRK